MVSPIEFRVNATIDSWIRFWEKKEVNNSTGKIYQMVKNTKGTTVLNDVARGV